MILDTLITDRTQADVNRVSALNAKGFENMTAAERTAYLTNLKGAYNASDLNRVGEAVEYVANRLNTLGGFDIHVTAKQDWTLADIPTQEQMAAYIADIASIRAALPVTQKTPPAPEEADNLTYTQANDIEQILLDVEELIQKLALTFVYSGQPYSGMIWEEFTYAG